MKIKSTTRKRSPLYHHFEYSEYEEIVYKVTRGYSHFRCREYAKVNFKDHIVNDNFQKQSDPTFANNLHAYALLINPLHSNMIVLDFDNACLVDIERVMDQFVSTGIVKHFDIASSTRDYKSNQTINRHLYIGLDRFYNTLPLYGCSIPKVCNGYLSCIRQKLEVVVRVSKKFNNGQIRHDTNIKWEEGYSKEGNIWLKYSSEQLIAPLTTADGACSEEILAPIKPTLKLRG